MAMNRYNADEDAKQRGLIWISEAMIEYKHAREWFTRRINDGRLETVMLPGTTKIYLKREQIEAVDQDDRRR